MTATVIGVMEGDNQMSYPVAFTTAEQLLLLPKDSDCSTPDTISAISSSCGDIEEFINNDQWEPMPNTGTDDSKSAYSLFESEYDIQTASQHRFPNWTWPNNPMIVTHSVPTSDEIHTSPSFYHLRDMNTEPVDDTAHMLRAPSQYHLDELRDYALYVNFPNAERTPTVR